MTAPTMPAQAPTQKAAGNGDKKVVPLRPFKIGAQTIDDEAYDVTVTLTTGSQTLTPQYEVPSTGFLNDIYILVQATTAANAAAVTFDEDAPFTVIDRVTFTDTNNAEIVGPIGGWDLYIIDKMGGYRFQDNPVASPRYFATTGAVATGGSFEFVLRIPIELVPRDALGSLPNKSSSTPFKVKTTVAASTAVYGTAPTNQPTVRFRMTPQSYWEPTANDGSGNPVAPQPPGVNTTQYWNVSDYTVNAGAMSPQLTSSVGFPIRNLYFVLRDSNGSRAQGETDFPDPFKLQLQSNILVDRIKALWQHYLCQDYGLDGAVGDGYVGATPTKNAKDNGVYVVPFNRDFYPKPGWENRRSYLRTTDGMRLKALGTIGGSGTHKMTVFTNYIGVGAGTTLAQITT